MGKCAGWWAPPAFWNFTPEQVENPKKLVEKYLEKVCCHPGNTRETKITATCWGLAHGYQALFNTIQNQQGEEKVSGSDDKMTGTVATPSLVIGTVATPTTVADTADTPTPQTRTAAEPENQPMPVSVTPIHKKKYTRKSALLVRDEDESGSSQGEQEEEAEPINEMVPPNPYPEEGDIDKAIGKGAQALSLWRRLLSGVKERYPFKEDVIRHPGKWTTMETAIQYLRELAMLEVIYGDLNNEQLSKDLDEVRCT
ncbi:hypothetical protein QYF61_007153 [Mycteria americana]|uniref:Uncharacterized protein n=1 Tax=Mycteria americana TaxID=33587 RepID=A0AAN7SD67_MYCAM|nr:hypothetical protein QYF61_007153 [Mycteria americana]